jgi:hypothetical protein
MPARAVQTPRRWVWVVAGVIGIIGLILAIMLLRSGGTSGPGSGPGPGVQLWADRDVIKPGEYTFLHWNVPGAEFVRLLGPGFDPQNLVPGGREGEVCPRETAAYRLLSPNGKEPRGDHNSSPRVA